MSPTVICVVERAKSKDSEARELIATLCCPVVYRWCRRWGVPREDVSKTVRRTFRSVLSDAAGLRLTDSSLAFRGLLWTHGRYQASEHPNVNSMSIPERYPEDVQESIVADDTSRLLKGASGLLRQRFPGNQRIVFDHLIEKNQNPGQAVMELPFSLREIRELKNTFLRRLRAEFGVVIGL